MKPFAQSLSRDRSSSNSILSRDLSLGTPASPMAAIATRSDISFASSSKSSVSQNKGSIFGLDEANWETLNTHSSEVIGHNCVEVYGIRVVPPTVTFADTFENQSYTKKVFVQNISNRSLTIRIYNPRAWSFRVKPIERGHQLAPGLKITRRMHYTCTKAGIVYSSLPIYVNDKCYHLPLEAYKGQGFVAINPTSIKFGRVDVGAKPVEKRLVIQNASSCATKFLVDLGRNDLDLQVTPLKGWIRPNSSVTIFVQLVPLQEGELSTEIWITTDMSQARVQVTVEASKRSLLALHPNSTSDFTLVDFPTTFYGSRRYQTIVIYNMAASSSAFVVLAELGNKQLVPIREAQKANNKHMKMFHIEPEEGRIRPFEGRIFTVWFQPTAPEKPKTGWKCKDVEEVNDYLCAVRIKRIQVDEFGIEGAITKEEEQIYPKTSAKKRSIPNLDLIMAEQSTPRDFPLLTDISVLLCLYGEAEWPTVTVVPDSLYFSSASVGLRQEKVLHITNTTGQWLAFRYKKIPFFKVCPTFQKLAPKATCDVSVVYCARNLGPIKNKLVFEIMAQYDSTDGKDFQVLNHLNVNIFGKVKSHTIIPEPKFNPGITPMITHEVGFLTDEVTFASEMDKPVCAMVAVTTQGRPWLKTSATIAFPNDMPLTLRPRPTDLTAKTIFKGLSRYVVPVDESVTYTSEQLLQKRISEKQILDYIRGTAAVSVAKGQCCSMRDWQQDEPVLPLQLSKDSSNNPQDVLVALTFTQLYRIRVIPALVSFGSMTTNKICTQVLTIENKNDFKISAKILPLNSGVQIQMLDIFIVPAQSETRVALNFQRDELGRYSGIITCVINGFHSFDIAVVAEVVPKSLIVSPARVDYKLPDAPFAQTYVPLAIYNPLNTPVSFSWSFAQSSPFKVEPLLGVTPKQGMVWCAAYFEPDSPNYKLHPVDLFLENSLCHKFKCGVTMSKPVIYFLEPVLNIGYIPLNLPTTKRFTVFNQDYCDAMFVVLNKEPVKGIVVNPSSGNIKGRSTFTLALEINVSEKGPLEFVVYINIQNSVTIEMKVHGVAVYPQVEITPKYISITRLPCNSVTRNTLVAENRSKARVKISFNMEEYLQFKVSLSKRHHDPGLGSGSVELEPGAIQKFYLHFIPLDLTSYDFYLPVVVNGLSGLRQSTIKEFEIHSKKIKAMYRKASFDSTLTQSHKVKSIPSQNAALSHLVLIEVGVLKPLLTFSASELRFTSTFQSNTITTVNVCDEPLNVIFRFEDSQTAFTIKIDNGATVKERGSLPAKLEPGEEIVLKAKFVATETGHYSADITVVLASPEHNMTYSCLRLSGHISPPCIISAATDSLYFPPVPLGVEFNYRFSLFVDAQDCRQETTVVSEIRDLHADKFTVEFVDGNSVPAQTKAVLLVAITFKSSVPISINKQVTFRSLASRDYNLRITASADNCLLTTHVFTKSNLFSNTICGDDNDDEDSDDYNGVEEVDVSNQNKRALPPLLDNIIKPSFVVNKTPADITLHQMDEGSSSDSSLRSFQSSPQSAAAKPVPPQRTYPRGPGSTAEFSNQITSEIVGLSLQSDTKEDKSEEDATETTAVTMVEGQVMAFPLFPLNVRGSEYAIYMHQTREAVQQWLYEQVFNCSYYPNLGSHSFATLAQRSKKEYSRSSPVAMRNIFDALERICGRSVRRYFTSLDKQPDDLNGKVMFVYHVYKQLLDIMKAQGALLNHVEPKYLMNYDDYYVYWQSPDNREEHKHELLSPELFRCISTQCWLDLALQMFRTLILAPTTGTKVGALEQEGMMTMMCDSEMTHKTKSGRPEDVLMGWLTQHYNTQRLVVWPEQDPGYRTITNLESNLEDGLVLAAVTAAHCPFLSPLHFQAMFPQPTTISQVYHNAVCLTSAWNKIKLGYSVGPRDLIRPNTVRMLMLVTHLYRILPSYRLETTVHFKATLNTSETQIVTLENTEEFPVTYHIEILPNNNNFEIENMKNSFLLTTKQKGQIIVKYTARSMIKVDAILLLCGACMPPKFGRNYVFGLEGHPVKLPVSAIFNISSPLNSATTTHITVETPHTLTSGGATVLYDIWTTLSEPQPGNLNTLSWATERKRRVPRRLYILSEKLEIEPVKRNKSGRLRLQVCCFSQAVQHYWIIFKNPEIGDFIVQLQITPSAPEPSQTLTLSIDCYSHCNCVEERQFTCSRSAVVNVLCRNLDQWSAVRTMFELTIPSSEKKFWATYLESNIGFRLLQWMLEEKKEKLTEEVEQIFKRSKTYKVSCSSPRVHCNPILHIPNVRAKMSVPVQLHVAENTPNQTTTLTLASTDGQEIRCYSLNISCNS